MGNLTKRGVYLKKGLIILTGMLLLVLTACSNEESVLGTVKEEDYTLKDYTEDINDNLPSDMKQQIYLEKVMDKLASKEKTKELVDYYLTTMEKDNPERFETLTDEEKQMIEDGAAYQAGVMEALKQTGVITDKILDEAYKDNNKQATVDVVWLLENKDAEEIEKVLKSDSDTKQEDIESIDDTAYIQIGTKYNAFTVQESFEEILDSKADDIISKETEEGYVVIYVNKIEEMEKEDLESDMILSLGGEELTDMPHFIGLLEENKVITLTKDLREYLQIDEEKQTLTEEGVQE